jgi:hypothetical protein
VYYHKVFRITGLRLRDYGAIDGDLIKATMTHYKKNNVVAPSLYFLDSAFKEIKPLFKRIKDWSQKHLTEVQ